MNRKLALSTLASTAALLALSGCGRQETPVAMAPPVSAPPPMAQQQNGGTFQWQDVPANQQIPIVRAVFDQGGYQLYAQTGDTIIVPFANQNLYVMKFGLSSNGQTYFIHDGAVPTLFVPRGVGLENASAQGAKWYPFSRDYEYQRPVYVGIAPSWGAFTGMGWYPGMSYYGGYWGYNPYGFSPMAGILFNIGGRPYYGWNSYTSYYRSNPGYVRTTNTFNYNRVGRSAPSSFGRSSGGVAGSSGSFGTGRRSSGGFGTSSGSSGSFGRSSGSSGTFGRSSGSSSGTFGRSSSGSGGSVFGSRPSGSFGSGSSGYGSSSRSSGGSFGSGSTSGYGSFGRSSGSSSGGSFGGSRSSGGSFGGSFGRSSGGSFGRSSGGFGGRRR